MTLLLFLYVMKEVGRKCVWDYAMAASGRMQYDYKQTNGLFGVGAGRAHTPNKAPGLYA